MTANKDLAIPASGSSFWNVPTDSNWGIVDTAFGGVITVNVVGKSGTYTLIPAEYTPVNVIFSGLLTANVNFQLPSGVGGMWTVSNATTGAFSVTISSAGGGTSLALVQGFRQMVVSDGTNVSLAFNAPVNPGGASGQMQFNYLGSFLAGSSTFTFDLTNYLFSSTKVGIGTASPGTELDVKGTLRLSGSSSGYVGFSPASAAGTTTYTLPAGDGTAGQFLTTNGSGLLSWGGTSAGVTTFSAGTTGLTPNTNTGGAVILAGTLATANGGTGLTAFTSGGAFYATSTSAIATGTLPVASGGTGATTAAAVYTGLGSGGSLVRTASGTATNSGLISWGTSAPSTLAEGQIYLRYT